MDYLLVRKQSQVFRKLAADRMRARRAVLLLALSSLFFMYAEFFIPKPLDAVKVQSVVGRC